jgi:hypothetical protein
MNEIIVPHGLREKLKKLFNSSYPTIRKALKGDSKSLTSLRIRKAALESGGVEVEIKENNQKIVRL